jgi:hypothetical protein
MQSTILRNNNVYIRIDSTGKEISFSDSIDYANGTSGYTTQKRGVQHFSKFLTQVMNDERLKDDINFQDLLKMFNNANIAYRTYCAVD